MLFEQQALCKHPTKNYPRNVRLASAKPLSRNFKIHYNDVRTRTILVDDHHPGNF